MGSKTTKAKHAADTSRSNELRRADDVLVRRDKHDEESGLCEPRGSFMNPAAPAEITLPPKQDVRPIVGGVDSPAKGDELRGQTALDDGPASDEGAANAVGWVCLVCTFRNDDDRLACEMCDAIPPRQRRPEAPDGMERTISASGYLHAHGGYGGSHSPPTEEVLATEELDACQHHAVAEIRKRARIAHQVALPGLRLRVEALRCVFVCCSSSPVMMMLGTPNGPSMLRWCISATRRL